MNRTEPSPNRAFTPPECSLLGATIEIDESALPLVPSAQDGPFGE
jgi:hypothetical protein